MSLKIVLFCAQALLIQAISSQSIGCGYNGIIEGYGWPGAYEAWNGPWEAGLGCGEWGLGSRLRAEANWENAALAEARYGYPAGLSGFGAANVAASNGGGLAVTSSSPIAPNGVSLLSENAFEGPLAVAGEIPFLGTVGLEGVLPTAGAGGVAYSCGNGNVGILNEDISGSAYGYGLAGPAYAGIGSAIANGLAPGFAPGFAAGLSPYGYGRGCGCNRI